MKNKLLMILFLTVLVQVLPGSSLSQDKVGSRKKPVNIILFIGDGMGPAQVSAAIAVSDNTLVFEEFPYSGYLKTSSSNNYVTDSAAGGTALACGVKTRNGMIGMGPDSTVVESIMEIAKKHGLATGLVSTSSITHATPASFIAHNSGRGNYEDIAKDFMSGKIDVFIGGGSNHFNKRKDNIDLTVTLKDQNYDVVYNIDDLTKSSSSKIAGLLAPEHMPVVEKGRIGMLAQMTDKAIQVLSKNKKGFVLMVEGSQIDFEGHDNDLDQLVREMVDFNDAIEKGFDFASKSRNTLIVVTADHETGGLSLTSGNLKTRSVGASFGIKGHSAVMVPVFSFGPGAAKFSGIHDNTFIFHEFVKLMGFKK